ncbi:hypothetical protein TRFO_21379 [Tritrichomonas foetus]|uniref:Uncharacterized protein n=1 Tax=Tritrichomonas foetus TaxID=1144522 RepID=A0A1J4KIM1_9EUKA|nr:hypothetical protein TRFO_21379 [Tritrichomonas foetus]|eukprot:OHT09660.1 hypothetical protein TRFO_21379 [Tritrichomonas foetus]
MLFLLIILQSVWFGYEIIGALAPTKWDHLMVLSCGIPFGFTVISWLFLFIRLLVPINLYVGVFVIIILILLNTFLHAVCYRNRYSRTYGTEFKIMSLLSYVLFVILIDKSILKDGIGSSGTVFSDIPFHLGLITSFSYGANSENLTMLTPFYYGEKLAYPIIPDFFSSILVSAGYASLRFSIAIPTLLLLMSTVYCVHFLALQFSGHQYVSELAVFCFLFASGVGWKWFFISDCRNDFNVNFSHCFCRDRHTFWIHPLIHFLLPQRSALFSIPISISILSLLIMGVDFYLKDNKIVFLAGILMGLLPLLSAHSYIGVGEYAIFLCLLNFPFFQPSKWVKTIKYWSIYGFTALFLSIPQVLWLLRVPRKGFMTFESIVTETFPSSLYIAQLWWESLGSFVFIALFGVFILMGKRQIWCYLPSIGVFIVSNFIRYQPGAMDNNKVFFAGWYPIACAAVSHFIVCLIHNGHKYRRFLLVVVSLVIFSFSFGSVVTIFKAIKYNFPLFTRDEMSMGEWIMKNTRKDTVVMGSGWHSSSPMSIGGRVITMGYGGWVWTHGLSYEKRVEMMDNLVQNRENVSLFDEFNIQYIVSKPDDRQRNFEFPEVDDSSHWLQLMNIGSAKLYRIVRD